MQPGCSENNGIHSNDLDFDRHLSTVIAKISTQLLYPLVAIHNSVQTQPTRLIVLRRRNELNFCSLLSMSASTIPFKHKRRDWLSWGDNISSTVIASCPCRQPQFCSNITNENSSPTSSKSAFLNLRQLFYLRFSEVTYSRSADNDKRETPSGLLLLMNTVHWSNEGFKQNSLKLSSLLVCTTTYVRIASM